MDEPSTNAKKWDMCVYSLLKCEASHKNIVKLLIGKLNYCLKVDEPSANAKNGIYVRICSKFSVKC